MSNPFALLSDDADGNELPDVPPPLKHPVAKPEGGKKKEGGEVHKVGRST